MATKPKSDDETRKILTPLDDQLDDSFPASDPPSLTDPSRAILPEAEEDGDRDADDASGPVPIPPRAKP